LTDLCLSPISFSIENQHRQKLIGGYLLEPDPHAQLQRIVQIDCAAK
jgi:hypothetical protein